MNTDRIEAFGTDFWIFPDGTMHSPEADVSHMEVEQPSFLGFLKGLAYVAVEKPPVEPPPPPPVEPPPPPPVEPPPPPPTVLDVSFSLEPGETFFIPSTKKYIWLSWVGGIYQISKTNIIWTIGFIWGLDVNPFLADGYMIENRRTTTFFLRVADFEIF